MFRQKPHILLTLSLSLAAMLLCAAFASAQQKLRNPNGLGLEQAWSKSIPTGPGGKISGVHIQVSLKETYQVNAVVDRYGRRQFFSDLDATPLSRGGYNQTERMTELKTAELTSRGLDPRLEQRAVPKTTVYVRSTSGLVTAVDAETGRTKWATQAGKNGYPSYSVAASEEFVVALSSTRMYLIDAQDGRIVDSVLTRSIPSGTPTIDGEFIYVSTWRGQIEVYSTEDFGPIQFTLGSTSPVVGRVTICKDAISWTSESGDLYVGNRANPGLKFRFESSDTISSAPAYLNDTIYATSLDGFVYAIDDERGNVKWRFSAGGPIDVSPLAIDDMIFATTRDGQLVCVDAESGEAKWLASGVTGFISASDTRLYGATEDGRLVVIEIATGTRLGAQRAGFSDLAIVNTSTDRLYLANSSGVISCLHEMGRRWPIVRKPPVPPQTDEVQEADDESTSEEDTFAVEDDGSPSSPDDAPAEPEDMEEEGDAFDDFGGDEFGDDGFGDDEPATDDDGGDPFEDF